MSITTRNIRANIARLSGLGKTGLVCSVGGSTGTIVSARVGAGTSPNLASYAFDVEEGSCVRMNLATANGEETTVTDFDRTTGALTVAPAFSSVAQVAAGTEFEVWRKVVHTVGDVDAAINRALSQRCFYWQLATLTLVSTGSSFLTLTVPGNRVGRVFASYGTQTEDYAGDWDLQECMSLQPVMNDDGDWVIHLDKKYTGPFFAEIQTFYPGLTADYSGTASDYTTDCDDIWVSYEAAYDLLSTIAMRETVEGGKDKGAYWHDLRDQLEIQGQKIVPAHKATGPPALMRA